MNLELPGEVSNPLGFLFSIVLFLPTQSPKTTGILPRDRKNRRIQNGYVLNNPLMFNDPSGESAYFAYILPLIIDSVIQAVIIGGLIYTAMAVATGNASKAGFLKTVLTSFVTGGIGAGVGALNIFGNGFWGTMAQGSAIGSAGGAVDAIVNQRNILQGLLKGAVIGGAIASATYAFNYHLKYGGMKHEAKYYNGQSNGNSNNSLEYSDKTLKNMRNEAGYDSTQMNHYRVGQDVAGSDYYSQSSDGFFQMSNGKAYAYTTRPNFFTMKSSIHYAKAAFASKELLFTTMVHETAHSYAMYGGNAFIKYLHDKKLFNSGYSTIGDLGHAAIYDLENYLSAFNKFPANPAIGMDKDFISNAINNNVTGNNVKEFNMLRNFLLPVFNRKLGVKTSY